MNNITAFYKLLKNNKKLTDSTLLVREDLINENIINKIEPRFDEVYINDYISNNGVIYENLSVKEGFSLFHDKNDVNSYSIDSIVFNENNLLGNLENKVIDGQQITTVIETISTKPLLFSDLEQSLVETESSINNIHYEKDNTYQTLKVHRLDTTNMSFKGDKFSYSNGDRYTFGLTEWYNDNRNKVISKDNINIVNEDNTYNIYITQENSLKEGKIGENILLMGDGIYKELDYWETELADSGVRFRNDGDKIIIMANEFFETVDAVGGIDGNS